MTKRAIVAGFLVAAFAFSAKADTWYDDNGVTVEGSGSATVAYRSESSGVWLDITVAEGTEATLTSLSTTTLSIQKLGAQSPISSLALVRLEARRGALTPNIQTGGRSRLRRARYASCTASPAWC